MADLNGVPGDPQVWKIGGGSYLVYTVPGSQPPVYMRWVVPSTEDLKALYGPDVTITYDRTITHEDARALGMLDFGTTTELGNFDEDPFLTWAATMKTQAEVQPWIMDDDYQALVAMATLEGRALTEAEIQTTDWWTTHTQSEREWMKLYHGDRETADQRIADNRLLAREALLQAGIQNPSSALINFMGDQVTKGVWSPTYYNRQVQLMSDPYLAASNPIDPELRKLMTTNQGTTRQEEDTVTELVRTWLGPVHGAWTPAQIATWAGKLRNDPDAQIELENQLRQSRLSIWKDYTDPSLTYNDIAAPWASFATSHWGQNLDETDTVFQQLIQNNDAGVNAQLLRQEGLTRGITKVKQDLSSGVLTATGGSIRRPV